MSSFDYVQKAVADLIDELAVAEVLCEEQAERIAALEAETAELRAALETPADEQAVSMPSPYDNKTGKPPAPTPGR